MNHVEQRDRLKAILARLEEELRHKWGFTSTLRTRSFLAEQVIAEWVGGKALGTHARRGDIVTPKGVRVEVKLSFPNEGRDRLYFQGIDTGATAHLIALVGAMRGDIRCWVEEYAHVCAVSTRWPSHQRSAQPSEKGGVSWKRGEAPSWVSCHSGDLQVARDALTSGEIIETGGLFSGLERSA